MSDTLVCQTWMASYVGFKMLMEVFCHMLLAIFWEGKEILAFVIIYVFLLCITLIIRQSIWKSETLSNSRMSLHLCLPLSSSPSPSSSLIYSLSPLLRLWRSKLPRILLSQENERCQQSEGAGKQIISSSILQMRLQPARLEPALCAPRQRAQCNNAKTWPTDTVR